VDPNRSPQIRQTRDGSDTLYSEEAGQYYHNPNGAVDESRHVFFETGGVMAAVKANLPVHIFETGFGTGLNLLLLDDALARHPDHTEPVSFSSLEAYPISPETARALNYGRFLTHPDRMEALVAVFAALKPGWNTVPWPSKIEVRIWVGDGGDIGVEGVDPLDMRPYTHLFHDPFSIEASPELWSEGMFARLRSMAAADALLSTYAAASKARAAMAAAGWCVARAPGALGKREMTLASPSPEALAGYPRVDEARLVARLRRGDFDAPSSSGS
jgi:tRNA U34 5-methylaminomethyl-2-thiouridine-forming methyltransferase MnmC